MTKASIRLGIVAAEFNYDIVYAMMELAKEHASFLDAEVSHVIKVPGVFDMPLAVRTLLKKKDIDAVVHARCRHRRIYRARHGRGKQCQPSHC